jgi:hypothetical protein
MRKYIKNQRVRKLRREWTRMIATDTHDRPRTPFAGWAS